MLKQILYAVGLTVGVTAVGLSAWLWFATDSPTEPSADPATVSEPHVVKRLSLTAEKLAAASILIGEVRRGPLQSKMTIPGRLDYDQDRHVAIKSACNGIIVDMKVQPGEQVSAGQTVAIVSSPDVGEARSQVRSKLSELQLAQTQKDWQEAICKGVEELIEMIHSDRTPQQISAALAGDSLGQFREKIVSAYTRARLARKIMENTREAADRGAIAVSVQQQRESEFQASAAALDAVLEQSLFEVHQQCTASSAALAQAQRQVDLSLQRLNTLLGPAAEPQTQEQALHADDQLLSNVNLISPIAGTVEERNLSVSERVSAGDSVYTVADVSHLWAVADVRERDWAAISIAIGAPVVLSSPAIADCTFSSEVFLVGRRVDAATGAASLIAKLLASDPRLRPGLFVRMTVATSEPRQVLMVPEQSVVVHEGQHFVFVAESESEFQRTDVEVGETQDGMTEILSGLKVGQRLVIGGAFILKSELLLAGEEE